MLGADSGRWELPRGVLIAAPGGLVKDGCRGRPTGDGGAPARHTL